MAENMSFVYDDGSSIEITKDVLVKLLHETSAVMVAYCAEQWGLSHSDRRTLAVTNRVMEKTWGNHEWLEKMIGYMYKRAKEINDGGDTNEAR